VARELKPQAAREADIVDLSHDGRGIARVEGKAVFIAGALPGERVRFHVIRRRRQLDEAALDEILSASPDRVAAKCAHFGVCGGCSLQHLAPAAQLAAKERQLLDNLERIGRVRPRRVLAPVRGPEWGYRRRARLGVKYVHKKGRVLAGFREREKPYIADVRRCEILSDRFSNLPQDLAALVDTLSIREKIPQVEVSVGDRQAALVFRTLEVPSSEDLGNLLAFATRSGVQLYLQSGGLDSIRAITPEAAPLQYAVDAGEVIIEFGPVDFIQVNREVNIAMVASAMELLQPTPGDAVLDLYCGLGNFTLPLARRSARVVGIEGDAALVAKASANATRNGIGNVTFRKEDLCDPARFGGWAAERYDLALLDPPRAGASEILERMPQWGPRRVVYISCHPGSLARDAGILVQTLGFELIGAGVMDMFPHTTHVESIAVFESRT
jgi:23S rRNA (uracil1939-C5)-methyltransferase